MSERLVNAYHHLTLANQTTRDEAVMWVDKVKSSFGAHSAD